MQIAQTLEQLKTLPLQDLLTIRNECDTLITAAKKANQAQAINEARTLIATYDLTPDDIFPPARGSKAAGVNKVAPKYIDPVTGATWTGRGKAPKWISGKDFNEFLINK